MTSLRNFLIKSAWSALAGVVKSRGSLRGEQCDQLLARATTRDNSRGRPSRTECEKWFFERLNCGRYRLDAHDSRLTAYGKLSQGLMLQESLRFLAQAVKRGEHATRRCRAHTGLAFARMNKTSHAKLRKTKHTQGMKTHTQTQLGLGA